MKCYLTDQSTKFAHLLSEMKSLSLSYSDATSFRERITTMKITLDDPRSLKDLDFSFLFNYTVFPSNIMSYLTEWDLERRKMKRGDVIIQQAFLPPIRRLSMKCVFAVRILEIFNTADKIGFSYGTLEGHPEQGISQFYATLSNKQLTLAVHTFSTPGNFLTRLVAPFLTLPYQAYCTKKALETIRLNFLASNEEAITEPP